MSIYLIRVFYGIYHNYVFKGMVIYKFKQSFFSIIILQLVIDMIKCGILFSTVGP